MEGKNLSYLDAVAGQLSAWNVIIEDSTIIPVELNNFAANVKDGKVYLSWETSSEINNQGFYIERKNSSSGENETDWIEIGFKEGQGNTTERNLYSFEDSRCMMGHINIV